MVEIPSCRRRHSDGVHSVVVYSQDFAGNIGSSPFIWFTIDSDIPYIDINNPTPLTENYDVILMIDCLAHAYNPYQAVEHIFEHLNKGALIVMYYENGIEGTHLARASEQREKTMQYTKTTIIQTTAI